MELIQVLKKEKDLGNYTWQKVTFEAPKGKLLKQKQIKKLCIELQNKLPKGSTMVVDGMNILRNTNLFSSYMKENAWLSDEEYDEYLGTLGVSEADQEKFVFISNSQ